jgi:hypothetical protein
MHIGTTTTGWRVARGTGIGLVLAASLALAGCGDSGPSQNGVASANSQGESTSTAKDSPSGNSADLTKWTRCLRDHGVDVTDPDPDTGAIRMPGNGEDPTLQKAMEKCQQYNTGQRGSTGADPNDPEQQQDRVKFAKCMRDKGVDWSDPVPGHPTKVPPATPQLRKAMDECAREVPGGAGE